MDVNASRRGRTWLTRGVIGIVVATFFSDVGHEMVTAVLPLYLESIGLGAAALGVMEGIADFLFSLAKLGGGFVGHRTERKKPLVMLGYLATTLGSGAMALVSTAVPLAAFRGIAWLGRGFRSPLRDFLLADEVEPEQFGRAYGVERSADMFGAVVGPLVAIVLVLAGASVKTIILVSVGPALVSVLSIGALTRDRVREADASKKPATAPLPKRFWIMLGGVVLFGLGDFSRSFLVLLASQAAGASVSGAPGSGAMARGVSAAVALYVVHNLVSAIVAYPAGRLGDRKPKLVVLAFGYALGVLTNGMLAWDTTSLPWLALAMVLSGTYIAIEETIEKATVAELLPRDQRSLGLGILASANAVGDMISSITVGLLLASGRPRLAFLLPTAVSALGTIWMVVMARISARERP